MTGTVSTYLDKYKTTAGNNSGSVRNYAEHFFQLIKQTVCYQMVLRHFKNASKIIAIATNERSDTKFFHSFSENIAVTFANRNMFVVNH